MPKDFCAVKDIKIDENRQRKFFDEEALSSLKISIEKHGQLQPIIIDHQYNLIAGERRLRCCTELNVPVWYVFDDAVTEAQKKEIELEENIRREGLQWYETAEAILEIHELKCREHGASRKGPGGKKWTTADTGNVLNLSRQAADIYIRLGRLCHEMPEIKKLGSLNAALAEYKRLKEGEALAVHKDKVEEVMAEVMEQEIISHKDYLIRGDCLELMKKIPNESIDIIYCDPMWGEDVDEKIRYANVINDDQEKCRDTITRFVHEGGRVLKNDRWMVMWFGITSYNWLRDVVQEAGLWCDPLPILWTKPNGIANDLSYSFGRAYETALMIKKGSPIIYEKRTINHFLVAPVPNKRHDFEKPVALAEQIMKAIALPGMTMLDGFMGSGTSVVAAMRLGLRPIGIEIDEKNFNIAIETWEREINNR